MIRYFLISFLFFACSPLRPQSDQRLSNETPFNQTLNQKTQSSQNFKDHCKEGNQAACLILGQDVKWSPDLAIMQGPSTKEKVQFVVQFDKMKKIRTFIIDKKTQKIHFPNVSNEQTQASSRWALKNEQYFDLKNTDLWRLVVIDELGELIDYRDFKTLDPNIRKLKFALVSCMRDDLKPIDGIWHSVLRKKPDVLFFIGDNVYIDLNIKAKMLNVDPAYIWQRHSETRDKLPVFRWKELVPIYSTWDDHDFGQSNGGADFVYKAESRSLFQWFFSLNDHNYFSSQGPGLSYSVTLSDQQFLFLDNRSYRTAKGRSQDHFGVKQEEWAFKKIKQFIGPTWLISGDQFFGGYHPFESYEGSHPDRFLQFKKKLKQTQKSIVFLSGDRHLSEIMKIPKGVLGYETYEFTSSPIHSTVYSKTFKQYNNPQRIKGVGGLWNYMLFESMRTKNKIEIKVEDYDAKDNLLFKENLSVSEL